MDVYPKILFLDEVGGHFYMRIKEETVRGGFDVTNSDIWWYLRVFGGKLATA